jgi:hypothetical protein
VISEQPDTVSVQPEVDPIYPSATTEEEKQQEEEVSDMKGGIRGIKALQ